MEVKLLKKEGSKVTYELCFEVEGSMLEMEEQIQNAVNELGKQATSDALSHFDTNGEPIVAAGTRYTSKGRIKKKFKPLTGR
jgi:hypothetical protein